MNKTSYHITARTECGHCDKGLVNLTPSQKHDLYHDPNAFFRKQASTSLPHCGYCQAKGYTEHNVNLLDVLKSLRWAAMNVQENDYGREWQQWYEMEVLDDKS